MMGPSSESARAEMNTQQKANPGGNEDPVVSAIGKVFLVRMLLAWAIPTFFLWTMTLTDFSHPHWLLGQYLFGAFALLLLLAWCLCHGVLRRLRRTDLHHYLIAYFIVVQPILIPTVIWERDWLPNTVLYLTIGGVCFVVYWVLFSHVLKRVRV